MNSLNSDPHFIEALEVLKSEFKLERLFLFGSRANRTFNEDSDYDFLLVTKDSSQDPTNDVKKVRRILAEKNILADIFVFSETLFNERKNEFGSMPETVLSTGIEVNLNE